MKTNANVPFPYLMLILFLGSLIGHILSDIIIGDQSSFIVELCIKAAVIAVCEIILYFLILFIQQRRINKNL